ncbi:hypothetical protein E2C01_100359 [Portunus trituberculatus]|uniref:Uncharacterized protein n=1 Tax=Portunus trituberculatus TaxID=210409 RepID=A0A5B7K6S8_PORTR|nr:hypothetical protein [Portunus trituberculatus]
MLRNFGPFYADYPDEGVVMVVVVIIVAVVVLALVRRIVVVMLVVVVLVITPVMIMVIQVIVMLEGEDVVPFSVSLYGEFLMEALEDLEKEYGSLLNQTQRELRK